VLGPELRAADATRRAPVIAAWRATPADWSDVTRCQHADLVTWLPDELLVKTDRVLMSFGLEGRVPFLDHRVVEFGLSLPDSLKVGGRQGKLFLKRWGERRLPAAHLWRRKRGFYVPMRGWLHGAFLDRLAVHLPGHPAIRRWFRADAVARLLREQQAGGNLTHAIWGLLQLAIWHRIFIDGHVPGRDEDPVEWLT
jgi:asparagine synthase (glutamine-hydrolysing)